MSSDKPLGRRNFFREGLRELLRPLGKTLASVQRVAEQFSTLESAGGAAAAGEQQHPAPKRADLMWLRPPGALPEQQFLKTCERSGECVTACPVKAIRLDRGSPKAGAAPFIIPDESPCVVCDGLYCMAACPSGALVKQTRDQIDMGTAIWRDWACKRTAGEECTVCVDTCPIGSAAIRVTEGKINVIPHGCVGCGVCQQRCPATPKAIIVVPKAIRHGDDPRTP